MTRAEQDAAQTKMYDDIGRIADAAERIADAPHRIYGPPDAT